MLGTVAFPVSPQNRYIWLCSACNSTVWGHQQLNISSQNTKFKVKHTSAYQKLKSWGTWVFLVTVKVLQVKTWTVINHFFRACTSWAIQLTSIVRVFKLTQNRNKTGIYLKICCATRSHAWRSAETVQCAHILNVWFCWLAYVLNVCTPGPCKKHGMSDAGGATIWEKYFKEYLLKFPWSLP